MNKKTIWDVFGVFLFGFCLAVMMRSQGIVIPHIPFVGNVAPEIVSVFGILIGAPCLILLTRFADRYRSSHPAGTASFRIPPVFSDDDGSEARWLGWSAFLLGPALAHIHFLCEFMEHGYHQRFTGETIPGGWLSVLTTYRPLSVLLSDDYRYHHANGVTVFPFWQPWFYLILVCFAWGYFGRYCLRLFRKIDDGSHRPSL